MREVRGGNSPGASLLLQGRGTSPGTACGPLRRLRPERESEAVEGSILVAERATPEDVGRILASSGTLTLGGALLSHVSLLSREFGKPSVSLGPGSRVRIVPGDEGPGILELGDVVGPDVSPILDEGDIVLLDGDHGTVRVAGGLDAGLRRRIAELHGALQTFAAAPELDEPLARVIDLAGEVDGPGFDHLLEAAFLNRVVPVGQATQRLIERLLADDRRRERMHDRFRAVRQVLVDRAESGLLATEVELRTAEAIDDLDRGVRRLEAQVFLGRRLIGGLGGDPASLDKLAAPILDQAVRRREALRDALGARVVSALKLPDEAIATRLGGTLQLLRRARRAGLDAELLSKLDRRLGTVMTELRAGIGDALVVSLHAVGPQDRGRVGGKAAGLLEVRGVLPRGCVVPRGFVVTSSAYRLHILGEVYERLESALQEGDEAAVSRRARAAILSADIPDEVVRAVGAALADLGAERVAVRSSASVEDGVSGSFAGQFDTALGVRGAGEALQRVRQTWASLWNARALRTMAAAGLSPLEATQAVLVQEMVVTRSAGVLVTRDPGGRPDTALINAAWGLGEGISQGEVPGDLFWVKRSTGETIRVEQGEGSTHIVLDPEGPGTVEVPLDGGQTGTPTLTEGEVSRVAELAAVLESATGRAQDVEFGFSHDGTLVIFQVRRVATPRHLAIGE